MHWTIISLLLPATDCLYMSEVIWCVGFESGGRREVTHKVAAARGQILGSPPVTH